MFISFIIPALNAEKTLEQCLRSIIALNRLPNFEVIVVLCQAKEEEIRIIETLRPLSPIHIVHTNIKNRSLSRNLGAKKAKGDFLAFIDSDVKLDVNWLKELNIGSDNKLMAAYQGSFFMDQHCDQYSKEYGFVPNIDQSIHSPFGPVIVTGACVYRSDIFHHLGKFDENVLWNEDLNLSVKAFNSGFALSYQSNAQATLLNKRDKNLNHLKRAFTSGQFHYHLVKHKFLDVKYFYNSRLILYNTSGTLKQFFFGKGHKRVKLLALLSNLSKLLGFTFAYFFQPSKKIYSFPLKFTPYLGFKESFVKKNTSSGLIVVNGKRHILDVKTRQLICIE